ncbi:hypothetical protein [Listeria booriae]|uniref:ICEBs1 excisionase n=1 Tax=Listeria booriae TaxID=1552123 RepID=A0A841ZTA4_9LIST|nr:hypothetical protein [Listeria booriae]MBC1565078.1 hypothetical protein [Listeria booriae]
MFKDFLTIEDVGKVLGYGNSASQKAIADLNKELQAKGYRIVRGKINKKYFAERYFLNVSDIDKTISEVWENELQANA